MRITLKNGVLTSEELLAGNKTSGDFTSYELNVLGFIEQWEQGQDQFIISTSGSIGKPKSIKLFRKDLLLSAKRTIHFFNLSSDDTSLICLDVKHIGGLMMLVRSLVAKMDIIIQEPNSDPFLRLAPQEFPTFAAMVPIQLKNTIEYFSTANEKLKVMRAIIVGGAPINWQLERSAQKLKIPIYQTFGMTETISHIAVRLINGPNQSVVYNTLDGWSIDIDEGGHLMINSNSDDSEWTRTNDIIEMIDKKSFKWIGRSDNVINSGGIKIHPELIETAIYEIFNGLRLFERFFVAGVPDETLGKRLIIIIEGRINSDRELQLLSKLREKLPKYCAPQEMLFIDRFLETSTGKIRRKATLDAIYLNK